jgi:hemoglobin-like flavoprotein
MDATQIELVRTTFTALGRREAEFAAEFYSRLFAAAPETRTMFPSDMAAQRRNLVDQLVAIVGSLDRLPTLVADTTALGHRHAGYGVLAQHYDLVLEAMLGAMQDQLGALLTPAAEFAWRRAYNLVAEVMLNGAVHGPADVR